MLEITISNNTSKKVLEKEIETKLRDFLVNHKVNENSEISIFIVDKNEMLKYVEKYLHETGEEAASHPVLSFVQNELEGPFQNPPDGVTHLGEIIVSIDHARDNEELYSLIEHGALHLLGIHHD